MQLFNTLQQQPSAQQLNTEPRTHKNSPIICNDTARLLHQRCRRRVAAMGCCGSKSASVYTAHEGEEAPLKPKMVRADHAIGADKVSPQDGAGAGAALAVSPQERVHDDRLWRLSGHLLTALRSVGVSDGCRAQRARSGAKGVRKDPRERLHWLCAVDSSRRQIQADRRRLARRDDCLLGSRLTCRVAGLLGRR
jgi:hypothetical protein